MFRFASPEWLLALLLVPLLLGGIWLSGRRRRQALERFGDPDLVQKLTDSVSRRARTAKAGLILGAVAFLALAMGRPQFGDRVETVQRRGRDIMVAVDLSTSMLARDVVPNRLDRARLTILRLIRNLDGDRIGLVAFAGDAFIQSPLTVDYSAAAMFLNAMEPGMMPIQGTDLGEALRMALDGLDRGAREDRTLVLVTDGEDHEGGIEEQVQRAVAAGVRVHTVGIGSPEGVPIPLEGTPGGAPTFKRDEAGNVVTTRLDEATLRRIADATGGRYVRVAPGSTAFDELMDELAAGEGEELEARQVTRYEEQYQIFLTLGLALLFLEVLIPERRKMEEAWTESPR